MPLVFVGYVMQQQEGGGICESSKRHFQILIGLYLNWHYHYIYKICIPREKRTEFPLLLCHYESLWQSCIHIFIWGARMGTAADWWRTDCWGVQVYEPSNIWILRACLCHPPHIENYLTMHYVQNLSHKNISKSSLVCENYGTKNGLLDLLLDLFLSF